MPEYAIGLLITGLIGIAGNLYGKLGKLDDRVDALAVKVAETYVTKKDFDRIEAKLDQALMPVCKPNPIWKHD